MPKSPPDNGKHSLLTVSAAANRLAVSPRTVRRLIDAGDLPVVCIGRAIRIAEDDLEEAIAKWRKDVN